MTGPMHGSEKPHDRLPSEPAGSQQLVAYLRTAGDDDVAREELDAQRGRLAAWLVTQMPPVEMLHEFVEVERGGSDRPALANAIAFCKAQQASLAIVSTMPIGDGRAFEPRISSVPVIVLPQPKHPPRVVMPLPSHAHDDVALYAAPVQNGHIPIYLYNPHSGPLTNITVTYSGFDTAAAFPKTVSMEGSERIFPLIEAKTCQLIELRNLMSEGESIDRYRVRFDREGATRVGVATVYKLFDPQIIKLVFLDTSTMAEATQIGRAPE